MLRLPFRALQVPLVQRFVSLPNHPQSPRTMSPTPWTPDKYPATRRSDHVDTYNSEANGKIRVADPYQWMEKDTDELDKWTSAQAKFTRSYLDKNEDRKKLEDACRASTDYGKVIRADFVFQFSHFMPKCYSSSAPPY